MADRPGSSIGSVYPWRRDSDCSLLVGPGTFIPELLKAIDAARHYILLEMYLVEPGITTTAIIDALLEAAARNVRIYIVFDGVGSRLLGHADRNRLQHPQIELTYFHPMRSLRYLLARDHRKLLLVDGRVGFTGGMGLVDGIKSGGKLIPWHDAVVRFAGSVVADWQAMFIAHWHDITHVELHLAAPKPQPAGNGNVRLVASQPARLNPIYGHLRQRVALASRRVWIATAYFLPSWRLRRALQAAEQRGVDVRLLLPGPITDHPAVRYASQRFYAALLKGGAQIYEYQPTFQHAKVTLVDDWVSMGSSNFDRWSMARNLEVNMEIEQPDFAGDVAAMFEQDFANSVEITTANWEQRSAWQRWQERTWGVVESWLDR